jgi:hypothetical protein
LLEQFAATLVPSRSGTTGLLYVFRWDSGQTTFGPSV